MTLLTVCGEGCRGHAACSLPSNQRRAVTLSFSERGAEGEQPLPFSPLASAVMCG